jgi:hypothetical protein
MKSIEHICERILTSSVPDQDNKSWNKYSDFRDLYRTLMSEEITPNKLYPIFNLERNVFLEFKSNRINAEEEILSLLSISSNDLFSNKNENYSNLPILGKDLLDSSKKDVCHNKHVAAVALRDFSLELLTFKRPRDSFGGKRRGRAFNILSGIANSYELPDIISLIAERLLKCKSYLEILPMIEFLKYYYLNRNISPPDFILETLNNLIHKTDDRSVAVSALDLMVETGEISEFCALSRIDDWKDRVDFD